jgi:hypothetical protein
MNWFDREDTMNRLCALALCLTCLCPAAPSFADSLVITYRSGKTQTIILDESSQAIGSLRYLGTEASPSPKIPTAPLSPDAATKKTDTAAKAAKQQPSKNTVKFKWSAPVIGE